MISMIFKVWIFFIDISIDQMHFDYRDERRDSFMASFWGHVTVLNHRMWLEGIVDNKEVKGGHFDVYGYRVKFYGGWGFFEVLKWFEVNFEYREKIWRNWENFLKLRENFLKLRERL